MSEYGNRRIWPWIMALLIGLPVLYVASFGPACWIAGDNEFAISSILNVYYPILSAARFTRREVSEGVFEHGRLDRWIEWYATLGRNDGAYPGLHSNSAKTWYVPERRP